MNSSEIHLLPPTPTYSRSRSAEVGVRPAPTYSHPPYGGWWEQVDAPADDTPADQPTTRAREEVTNTPTIAAA